MNCNACLFDFVYFFYAIFFHTKLPFLFLFLTVHGRHVDPQNPHASMGFHESAMTCELLNYIFTILSIASLVFSALPNAVRRKYPSPLGPKPDPGVPTTLTVSSR